MPLKIAVLSLGGALGVNARYWLAIAIDRQVGTRFPWATLTINATGAFALGLLATAMARLDASHPLRLATLVGFLGGYTTFSTFALEIHKLVESGSVGRSIAYAGGSVTAGLVGVTLGVLVGRSAFGSDGAYPRQHASVLSTQIELAETD
jgi:CrcB protein